MPESGRELFSGHRVFVPNQLAVRPESLPSASALDAPVHVPEAPHLEFAPVAENPKIGPGFAESMSDAALLVSGVTAAPLLVALALYGVGKPLVKRVRRAVTDVEMAATLSTSRVSSPRGDRGDEKSERFVSEYDAADADESTERRSAAFELLKTAGYFSAWYFLNTANNIFNKKALTAIPLPWTAATVALASGIPYVFFLWGTGLRPTPKLSLSHIKNLSGVCAAHLCAHVGGTIAIGAGAVSFIQIVKASEPVVSCILSASLLGQVYSLPVYLTLLPIVGGVALSSFTELSFTWLAFGSAMLSNVAGSFRAIMAKKAMNKPQGENMSDANLYAVLTIMSFLLLLPISLMIETPAKIAATWSAANAAGIGNGYILSNLLSAGFCYYLYNETAFLALGRVTPVTHAVANTVKRIVIILVSVGIFSTKMTPLGMVGSGIAVFGAFLYALAKQFSAKKPVREVSIDTGDARERSAAALKDPPRPF
jgi:solute carrier family 35 protein E1